MTFSTTRSARLCAERLHLTSKMGNVMTVFVDKLGELYVCSWQDCHHPDLDVKLRLLVPFYTFVILWHNFLILCLPERQWRNSSSDASRWKLPSDPFFLDAPSDSRQWIEEGLKSCHHLYACCPTPVPNQLGGCGKLPDGSVSVFQQTNRP